MPLELTNDPTFMDLMNRIFHEYLNNFFIVFVDNILIYFDNEQTHKERLRFEVMSKNKLYLKFCKCAF